ncbi:Myelin-oligodendrocyte glycoprotein [Dissostichus eleginoides]|uniref:Myelin-oligodendrocyte glycoprotein n=1 Tax=Dissostichus eleginoides TaxID=100907 RepID=A0AAD9BYT8_DISEL|nr:Myelin-oligodendrocyte glycoprotein [Dissostichus eleginoides]
MVHFGVFVLGFSLPFWSFTAAHSDDKGRHLTAPRRPIKASEGDDVILPCFVSPDYNVEDLTVEWSLPDLKPDPSDRLSRVEYVFVYRRRREEVDMKLQKFIGRTELFEDELKVGNISLKISNVTLADAGKYRCFIPKLKGRVKEAVVRLVVDPRANITLTTETQTNSQTPDPNQETDVKVGQPPLWIPVLSVCIVLVMVVVGFGVAYFLRRRCVNREETTTLYTDETSSCLSD